MPALMAINPAPYRSAPHSFARSPLFARVGIRINLCRWAVMGQLPQFQ
jgi:hypothetical protein